MRGLNLIQLHLLVILSLCSTVFSACEDKVDEENYIISQGEKLTSCEPLKDCHRRLCDVYGGEDEICCKTCRKLESQKCANLVTECFPFTASDGQEVVKVTSCEQVVKKFPDFCARDHMGGRGNRCCKACRKVKCVNSIKWRYRGRGAERKGQGLSCRQLFNQLGGNFMRRACAENKRGMGQGAIRIQKACCVYCKQLGK